MIRQGKLNSQFIVKHFLSEWVGDHYSDFIEVDVYIIRMCTQT